MCDNTAVRWSEWESERSRIESEVRTAMSQKLLRQLKVFEANGYPESYLQGFSRAREVVLSVRTYDSEDKIEDSQQSLFD